jgi:hypothetical protein
MLHCCRANNGPTMLNCNEAWKYDNSTIRIASKCGNALGNFDRVAHTGGISLRPNDGAAASIVRKYGAHIALAG